MIEERRWLGVGISIFYEEELDVEDAVDDILVEIGGERQKSEDEVVFVGVDEYVGVEQGYVDWGMDGRVDV